MKKKRIIAAVLVLASVAACLISGKYYIFREKDEKIISLEVPPFSDEIVVNEGETAYENYFEVVFENGFSYRDIEFVSENEKIATVKYSVTDRNRYICFKVEGISAGETEIYFSANGGNTVSERIKVTVLPKKTDYINETSVDVTESEETGEPVENETALAKTEETTAFPEKTSSAEKNEKSPSKNEPVKREDTVYVTPTGKRYHYSKSCAGKNGRAVSVSEAVSGGKTPCKKCAGG